MFSKGKCRNLPDFYYNNNKLDIVDNFSYLGICFNYNAKFSKTKKLLCDQARKAMYSILKKSRSLFLDIDLQLQLFDAMIAPILLYGSEVWGCEDSSIIAKFQLQYLKLIMSVKKSTPNVMIFGELGVLPINLLIKNRVLNYWCKIVNNKQDKICNVMYRFMFELHKNNTYQCPWLTFVKESLEQLGFSEYWINQSALSPHVFQNIVKSRIKDQYIQTWNESVNSSNKCINYRIFKKEFMFESYLKILPKDLALSLFRYRCCNHKLPIEKGRFNNIERVNRICHLCPTHALGDEFHYIFECSHFRIDRNKFVPLFLRRPNTINLQQLFQSNDTNILLKLSIFVRKIMQDVL